MLKDMLLAEAQAPVRGCVGQRPALAGALFLRDLWNSVLLDLRPRALTLLPVTAVT